MWRCISSITLPAQRDRRSERQVRREEDMVTQEQQPEEEPVALQGVAYGGTPLSNSEARQQTDSRGRAHGN